MPSDPLDEVTKVADDCFHVRCGSCGAAALTGSLWAAVAWLDRHLEQALGLQKP